MLSNNDDSDISILFLTASNMAPLNMVFVVDFW